MFQPLHNLVTVVLDKKEAKTPGGIIFPDNFDGAFLTGTVRAVGPGPWGSDTDQRNPLFVVPGDKVLIAQHIQQDGRGNRRVMPYPDFVDDGVAVVLCDEAEILGILERHVH